MQNDKENKRKAITLLELLEEHPELKSKFSGSELDLVKMIAKGSADLTNEQTRQFDEVRRKVPSIFPGKRI